MAEFQLRCIACERQYDGKKGFRLRCDAELEGQHGPALLRPVYEERRLRVRAKLPGIFKYVDWLPTGPYFVDLGPKTLGEPYCYRSSGLAERLGLKNLHIAFSGYWPERGINLHTRTFKEFEVQASLVLFLQSFAEREAPPFLISSAGNTANSYNYHTHLLGLPLYLFVPESGLHNLALPFQTSPFLVAVKGDYSDAVVMADKVSHRLGLVRDGGAMNPGRRAGMGTVMLHAVAHPQQGAQRTFHHYFQAVGSASGAIAAWEATQLLLADGRFGDTVTQIHMAQNHPFVPIASAWRAGRSELIPMPDEQAYQQVGAVTAAVLTNRRPPYAIAGGIHDVLRGSKGEAWEVTNERLFLSANMFRTVEGIDIGPAASVAVDALRQAVAAGRVLPEERVLLHITGGGKEVPVTGEKIYTPLPEIVVEPDDIEGVIAAIGRPERISPQHIFQILKRYGAARPVSATAPARKAKPGQPRSPAARVGRSKSHG